MVVFFNVLGGMPWFTALKYIIIPVIIGLTYFERAQMGKYDSYELMEVIFLLIKNDSTEDLILFSD